MGNQGLPTLAPDVEKPISAAPKPAENARSNRDILRESIAKEDAGFDEETPLTGWKTLVTGLLWVGYSIAIALAIVLVGSAIREMLR